MSRNKQLKVLISHSWMDKMQAEKLAKALDDFCEIWMDYKELRPGDDIQRVIDQKLDDVDLMLVIWTEHAMDSKGVAAEIETALRLGKRIVPCIFNYDDQGRPSPSLSGPLKSFLGIDFNHFGTGVARLTTFMLEIQSGEDPEYVNDPRMHMLQELDGMLDYLANYRNVRGIDAPRSQWVDWIIDVIEKYAKEGGDSANLELLLEAARRNQDNDPEALGELTKRLESLKIGLPQKTKRKKLMAKKAKKAKHKNKSHERQDILAQRISEIAPAGKEQDWNFKLDYYIQCAPAVISALQMYSLTVSSPAGCEVVNYLNTYLQNGDDLLPDNYGRYGLIDDAWLIHNTAYRLVESGIVPANVISVNWQEISKADQIVSMLLPPEVRAALEQYVLQMLNIIAREVQGYRPQYGANYLSGGSNHADRWYDVASESLNYL
jgi:hypothetical protein